MLQIYLPIAKISASLPKMLFMGFAGGVFSGFFGVGSGFFIIPIMIMMGISPLCAIVASNGQVMSASVSSFIMFMRKGQVDFLLGHVLLSGLFVGITVGGNLFQILREIGVADSAMSICYIVILGLVGSFMALESYSSIIKKDKRDSSVSSASSNTKLSHYMGVFASALPFKFLIKESEFSVSAIIPMFVGFLSGVFLSLAGISTNFTVIPAMLYIMRVPANVAIGTAFYTSACTSAIFIVNQSLSSGQVDFILIFALMAGAIPGANLGRSMVSRRSPEMMRALLAIIMLSTVLKLSYTLVIKPDYLYKVIEL